MSFPAITAMLRWETLVRLAVTSLSFLLAAAVPHLDLFISLLGTLARSPTQQSECFQL